MKTLAEVITAKANPDLEPRRDQRVVFDGRDVLMLCALERTAVLEVNGLRLVVALTRIEVRRPARLLWQDKEDLKGGQLQQANTRRYRTARARRAAEAAAGQRAAHAQATKVTAITATASA